MFQKKVANYNPATSHNACFSNTMLCMENDKHTFNLMGGKCEKLGPHFALNIISPASTSEQKKEL
jgi:hypothetical protein